MVTGRIRQAGLFDLASFAQRVQAIDMEVSRLKLAVDAVSAVEALERERRATLLSLVEKADQIPRLLEEGDPLLVNHTLKALVESIVVYDLGHIEITYRE